MVIHTFGEPGAPVAVLLHPMLVTGLQMAELLGKKLPGSCFLITPDQGGHGENKEGFVSPKAEAEELYRFLSGQGIREISLLFGASMGGVTAMELMKLGGLRLGTVHLDGVPLAKLGGIQALLSPLAYSSAQKKAKKDPAAVAGMLSRLYGEELGMSMAEQLGSMSANSVRRILKACLAGCAAPLEAERFGRLTFEWGEKELNIRKGKPLAEKLYPWASILVRKDLGHCEFLGREPEAYARELGRELMADGGGQ